MGALGRRADCLERVGAAAMQLVESELRPVVSLGLSCPSECRMACAREWLLGVFALLACCFRGRNAAFTPRSVSVRRCP